MNEICEKKSVLISTGILARGGIRTHLYFLCKMLREIDVEVFIFASGSRWTLEELEEVRSLGVKFVTPPKALVSSKYISLLSSLALSTLHLGRKYNSLYCISTGRSHLYLRRLVSKNTVGIYHEIVSTPQLNSLGWRCAFSIGTIVANSRKIGQEMTDLFPESATRVIPFLTSDNSILPPQIPSEIGLRELKVVYLGRIVAHKRPDQLVREWKAISSLSPLYPARLDVYGFDDQNVLLDELRNFVVSNGLAHQICLHGNYEPDCLSQILAQADLVVLPSLYEGLPLVLVEAMQRGVPIVATSAGGTEEFAENNPDVIITDLEWSSFVSGLLTMSGKLRSGLIDSIRLHKWVEERYGYDAVATQWQNALLYPNTFFR
jgi:glycosyltransferase involved in cell wall biosynthesis